MTLRHRLLMVYLIVMLLSVATVGVAIYELSRTANIYGPLLVWYDVVRDAQRLEGQFRAMVEGDGKGSDFEWILTGMQQRIGAVSDYLDVDYIRDYYIIRLRAAYESWQKECESPAGASPATTQRVWDCLTALADVVERNREKLNEGVQQQRTNQWALLVTAIGLAGLHVVVIGWLLRRWLLGPMERLNRQVEALAKDQPPSEPLLNSPLEMARLASALDRARRSLQVYRQQLIDTERLTTIGQFAAQLAHNLRNPLASIRAVAQVVSRHERGNAYVGERMAEIVACVDRLNHWIGGLMEIARREATPPRRADVTPLLQRIRTAIKDDLAVKELSFTVEVPPEGLVCVHDPATLEQALIAMVVNAIEASPVGGAIVLRAERVEGEKGQSDKGIGGQGDGGGAERRRDGGMERWGEVHLPDQCG